MPATKTRKRTTRKGGAKGTAASKAKANGGAGKRDAAQQSSLDLAPKVKELKDTGDLTWAEIGKELNIQPTKAIVLYDIAKVRPKDRVKELDADTVVELRDAEELSWSEIAGRATAGGTYTTIPQVKALYKKSGKKPKGRKGSASAARSAAKTQKASSKTRNRRRRRPSAKA